VDVVGQGQDLQSAPGHRRKEVIDVLASHDMGDGVAGLLRAVFLADPTLVFADLGAKRLPADRHIGGLGLKLLSCEGRGIRLHSQAVPGSGPEFVELGVAIEAGLGANEGSHA